ncbi:MAG: hypothetical protein ACLSC6_11955 [Anaerobutyricum hallii]
MQNTAGGDSGSRYGEWSKSRNNGCYKNGYYILKYNAGIRPALCLKLSSNLFSYAGTVSSDGTVNEVGYDSECGWILK